MERSGDGTPYRERTAGLARRVFRTGRGALVALLAATLAACPGGEEGGPIGDEAGEAPPTADTMARPGAAPGGTAAAPGDTAAATDTTAGADGAIPGGEAGRRVGTLHPPVPEGVEKRAGAVVTRPGQDAADSELGLVDVVAQGARQLWLSELLRRESDGTPVWRVVDVVEVGAVRPEERVLIFGCRSPDRDWGVAAVMRDEDEETLTAARLAWRVDEGPPRLEPIAPEGVRCRNEGLGTP